METLRLDQLTAAQFEVDVATAKNTGIPCIAVTWGFRSEETLREAGAVHFAHTAEELIAKISELLP